MIQSIKHLAYTLHISEKEILFFTRKETIPKYYKEYAIEKLYKDRTPKKDKLENQKKRIINPSVLRLKEIQKIVNREILKKIPVPAYIFGGTKGKDNVLNAKIHQGKKFKFVTDLTNFFPSITNRMVYEMFVSYNFSPDVASLLTKLTTFKGHVPQGAPTSTYIANLVFTKTGNELSLLAQKHNISFTSFVDDLTFSSSVDFKELVPDIIQIITKNGFVISHQKTHYQTHLPSITGIICYNNKLDVTKEFLEGLKLSQSSPKQYQGKIGYKEKVDKVSKLKVKELVK